MNKEYHYTITRTDRIYLIIFVLFLLGWELIKEILPPAERAFTYISPPSDHHGFKAKTNPGYSPNHYPKKFNPLNHNYDVKKYSTFEDEQESNPPPDPISIITASIQELTSMGITRKVAYHIQKFIAAGGNITSDQDLLKIYGMDSLQLKSAVPYIIYGTKPLVEKPITESLKEPEKTLPKKIVDLNSASLEDLESLSGIGEVLATRILKYRNAIGGFLNKEQLKECYGLPQETIDKINDQITISEPPRLLFINRINLDSLNHPYLNKKIIRLIKAYKKQHGEFKTASAFRKIYPPDSMWCNKILPYISFESN
ncbi:MAG: helix-hairpin-helix domain-containing protein [Saprospiraceae bacterium]